MRSTLRTSGPRLSAAALGTLLLLSGCLSLQNDEDAARRIEARGQASLRGSQEQPKVGWLGPAVVRCYVTTVDEPPTTTDQPNAILALDPGERVVLAFASVQIPRFGGFDKYTCESDMRFVAAKGRSCALRSMKNP